MSFFSGYTFFVYLIVLLVPAVVLGIQEKNLRYYRLLLTVFFVWRIYRHAPMELVYLLIYVLLSVYLVNSYLKKRSENGRRIWDYRMCLTLALLPLVVYKIGEIRGWSLFGFLGISYICFRVLQVIIEIYDGVIKEIDTSEFIEFLLFFPTLSSGPIDRSRRFSADNNRIWKKDEYLTLAAEGIYKLVLGVFYKVACSGIFFHILETYFTGRYRPVYLIGYAYVYGFYLFFDFAGYSAMAVGTSYILGIRMPDNFNKPFLSIDIKDFWNRWHITLSSWFRDFIFTRFIIDSARKKRFSNRLTGAAVGLILNMTIMGIWHGLSIHYIVYGIYHGCILAMVEVYQKKSSFYKKYKSKKWYIAVSWFINLNVVMLGFLIFSGYLTETWHAVIG